MCNPHGLSRAQAQVKPRFSPRLAGLSSRLGVPMTDPARALITRDVAAHAAGVKTSAITMWTSRGWKDPATGEHHTLAIAGRDWRGRALFRYADVMAAEQATRRRGRQRDKAKWSTLNGNSSGMAHAS